MLLLLAGALAGCFPGGFFEKGGFVDHGGWIPAATLTHNAPYRYVCPDEKEILRREELLKEGKQLPGEAPVLLIPPNEYHGQCPQEASTSVFYLFHLFPATPPMDPHYAMGLAVQKVEGDTMINIKTWHETHYYSILGHARVFYVKGDVIRFDRKEKK
ncbi:MAG: hypothetical protein KDK33_06915 [Leptospiraceae bacterium]|nr:hypothetical protein [Leptospiraceae bacterium]